MLHQTAIVSLRDDLHAWAVADRLKSRYGTEAHLIDATGLARSANLQWSLSSGQACIGRLRTLAGDFIDVDALDLLWSRRLGFPQAALHSDMDELERELIERNCAAATLGLLESCFSGVWIDPLLAVRAAENKLNQLSLASKIGLKVPRTLVTQDVEAVRELWNELPGGVIVKPLKGSSRRPLFTLKLTPEMLLATEGITAAPAMYQECVLGSKHLRVNIFGDAEYTFCIWSERLDWRGDITVPIEPVALDSGLRSDLESMLASLGLTMGIFGLKIDTSGQPIFLELNPQGQFLFLEGLTGAPLTDAFAEFLYDRLVTPTTRSARPVEAARYT